VFEASSYNDLRRTISGANVTLGVGFLVFVYLLVLTPSHKRAFGHALQSLRLDPLMGSVVTIALLAAAWGYLTTALLRLHDRLYEPHLVSWRAGYEADFILRSLCLVHSRGVSQRLFTEAFTDARKRQAFMQRLFYKFVGDAKSPHQDLLERFYTVIRNYWLLVLTELYCTALLVGAILYSCLFLPSTPPYRSLLGVLVASIALRVWSNRYLRNIRPITVEQIGVILREHKEDFERELDWILDEYGLRS
jgi:hypothetical protein